MYIVATISKNHPADKVEEILRAGATVLRYNFSHGTPEEVQQKIAVARQVIAKLGLEDKIKILADLPGDKLRLGAFASTEYAFQKDQELTFASGTQSPDPAKYIPIDYPQIASLLSLGQVVTLGDGESAFEVVRILDQDTFIGRACNRGHVPSLKAFNVGRGIDQLDHITQKTIAHIKGLSQIRPEWIAFSFVNSATFLQRAKKIASSIWRLIHGNQKLFQKLKHRWRLIV